MDNRVIAILEHFGFLTRQEAEHLAEGIKTGVGSESYIGGYNIVKDIITTGEFKERALLPDIETRLKDLEAKVSTAKVPDIEKLKIELNSNIETMLGNVKVNVPADFMRKVADLEAKVKVLETKLTEKDKKVLATPLKTL